MASENSDYVASKERLLDVEEIENLLSQEGLITRQSVKAHLEALAQKLRKDASALKRLEDSKKAKAEEDQTVKQPASEAASGKAEEQQDAAPPATKPVTAPTTVPSDAMKYKSIDKFSFDAGSYNSPTVTIYVLMNGIGSIPDKSQIKCAFTSTSFDLTIHDFNGVSYRLLKDSLANEIDPEKSKFIVKPNKILIKLAKRKTDYGTYDSWNELSSNKSKKSAQKSKQDPTAGIMDLMKDMYDKGDDNMKKMIGETMMKSRQGKLNDDEMGKGFGSDMPMNM